VKDESADLVRDRWASRSSRGVCPMSGDALAVPPKERVGGDWPACSSWAGERSGDGAEQGSVAVVDRWSVDLAAKDGELVSKHDDLELLGTTRADRQTGEHRDEAEENADHSSPSSAAFPLVSVHDRIFGPHTLRRARRSTNATVPPHQSIRDSASTASGRSWARNTSALSAGSWSPMLACAWSGIRTGRLTWRQLGLRYRTRPLLRAAGRWPVQVTPPQRARVADQRSRRLPRQPLDQGRQWARFRSAPYAQRLPDRSLLRA